MHQFDGSDRVVVDRLAQRRERRIEAVVETHHQFAVGVGHRLEARLDPVDVEFDRPFAEDGLAGADKSFDKIRMRVRRCADDNRIDVVSPLDFLERTD